MLYQRLNSALLLIGLTASSALAQSSDTDVSPVILSAKDFSRLGYIISNPDVAETELDFRAENGNRRFALNAYDNDGKIIAGSGRVQLKINIGNSLSQAGLKDFGRTLTGQLEQKALIKRTFPALESDTLPQGVTDIEVTNANAGTVRITLDVGSRIIDDQIDKLTFKGVENISGFSSLLAKYGDAESPPEDTPGTPPGDNSPAPEPEPDPDPIDSGEPEAPVDYGVSEAHLRALKLWRNNDLSKHPKGSCSGCHGADFFDLARIGTTETDIIRRALIDGATQSEADDLVTAILEMRANMRLPETNAREFRPLQPGGEVLLPDLDEPDHIKWVKRDTAFGESLRAYLPTVFGPRINSLADAKRARDEYLDIAKGSNIAGSNFNFTQLRDLPIGLEFPLWSADLFHGPEEGTLNDWIADLAREPKPEHAEEWTAIQDRYLNTPSTQNFWRMFTAAETMLRTIQPARCTDSGRRGCSTFKAMMTNKFRAALIGQHIMRAKSMGTLDDFLKGPIAFSYITEEPELEFAVRDKHSHLLPSGFLWLVGANARLSMGESRTGPEGTLAQTLEQAKFPDFVVESVDPLRRSGDENFDTRIIWNWIGFTLDPSLQRLSRGSTKTGEYLIRGLLEYNLHLHNAFQANMRLVTKGFLEEPNVNSRLHQNTPIFNMDYRFFVSANRHLLRWKSDKKRLNNVVPQNLRDSQQAVWVELVANSFRMSMYLFLDEYERTGFKPRAKLFLDQIEENLATYQPEHQEEDRALINKVRAIFK